MKKYVFDDYGTLYIGTTREISSLYKNLKAKTNLFPRYEEDPMLCNYHMYGLHVDENGAFNVISADACLATLLDDCFMRRLK